MADTKCRHRGTMTLTPCEDKGWETLDWCFYQEKAIKGECPKDCPHRYKPDLPTEPLLNSTPYTMRIAWKE